MGLLDRYIKSTPIEECKASTNGGWSGFSDSSAQGGSYAKNPYALRCISLRASAVAALSPLVLDADGNEITQHPINSLLRRPNPRQTWRDLIYNVEADLTVHGNAYLYPITTIKGVAELWHVPADKVSYIGNPSFFTPVKEWTISAGSIMKVPPEGLIHIHGTVGKDGVQGIAPLDGVKLSIEQQETARLWNIGLMKNGGKPTMVVEDEHTMTPDQYREFKTNLNLGYAGPSNAGNIMVLDGGKTVQFGGFSARDMDYSLGVTTSAREIAIGLSVPSELIGDAESKCYASMIEARQAFATMTVVPEADMIYEAITMYFAGLPGNEGITISYDRQELDALRNDESALLTALNACEYLTTNEKRARLSYQPVDNGDVILTTMGKVPLSETATDIDEIINDAS